jgi:hypothetical protein
MINGNSQYGAIVPDDIPNQLLNGRVIVTSATTTVTGYTAVPIGAGATQLQPSTVQITINDIYGYFATGDVTNSAITLLHELGHAYYDLPALGGSPILPDNGNLKQSRANQQTIAKDCF